MRSFVVREKLREKTKYLSDIERAKYFLGKNATLLTDREIQDIITKFEYLAEGFLDIYEGNIYQGKTLEQLLHNE